MVARGEERHYLNELKQDNVTIELQENTNEHIVFTVTLNSYKLEEITTERGIAYRVNSTNGSSILESGSPDLSKLAQSVIIPNMEEMTLNIHGTEFIEIGNIEIAPSKGNIKRNINPNTIKYTWNENYTKDEFFPGKLGELNDPYILRDYRGQSVWVYPYQYNPVQKILRIYTQFEIELVNTGKVGVNPKLNSSKKLSRTFNYVYQKQFLNYKQNTKYTPVSDEGNMLVISHPDFIDAMQEFVDWKRQKGMNIEMISLDSIGYSNLLIEKFVENYYNNQGLTYLLLVGDSEHIRPLTKSGDSDAAFGHIIGNDSYAEVLVGRFSAQSDLDLAVQIQRTIFYERDIDENANWLNKAIGIASNEGGVGIGDDDEKDKVHMDNIRQDLLNYGYSHVDQIYDPGAYSLKVTDAINEGRSLINYVGHGSNTEWVTSNFDPTDINELTNEYKYPYIFDVACINGNFKGLTCFAEAFVRAHKDSVPTGAVAIIASTINQDWAPPMDAQDEMVDILVESYENNIKRSFGGITINGCMHMNDQYGSVGANMTNTWAIFGDPSLIVRTKQPEKMIVLHEEVIVKGFGSFDVYCDIEGAYAVLSNSDSIIAAGYIINGKATLDVSEIDSEFTANVTVTGYNKVTYQSDIEIIISNGPYVLVRDVVIGEEQRIVNGELDYNEEVTLNFELENIGLSDAINLSASLSVNSDYVLTHANCENQVIGDILIGEVFTTSNQFTITISDSVYNQMNLGFELVITSDESDELWTKELNFKVNAPDLVIKPLSFIEVEGDNNNRIDPGEIVSVVIDVLNSGDAVANDVIYNILTDNPYLTISQIESNISEIEIDSTYQLTVEININESAPVGVYVPLFITLNSGLQTADTQIVIIGSLPEVNLGEGVEEATKYPFYNYYSSNRTQIVYTVDELGAGKKTFDAISLFLTRFPEDVNKRMLSNFTIKAHHTSSDSFSSSYINTSESTIIYQGDYQMPGAVGEIIFEVNSFEYNGVDNLVIEFVWGENSYFTGSDSYKTLCSVTEKNTVGYGYQDNTPTPGFIGVSNIRPNTIIHFVVEPSVIHNVEFEVINSNYGFIHESAVISIGGLQLVTDVYGKANTDLAEGKYVATADAGYSTNYSVEFTLSENNQVVVIDMKGTSISEAEYEWAIYPNPATDYIEILNINESQYIQIYDLSGKIIYSDKINSSNSRVDISHIPSGVYIVKIVNSSFCNSSKLIVE